MLLALLIGVHQDGNFCSDLPVDPDFSHSKEITMAPTLSHFYLLNPTKDSDRQLSFLLSRLFRAFRNEDPNDVQQKAVPPCDALTIARINQSEFQLAMGQLVRLGFFFA
jgi:hypothetical protein